MSISPFLIVAERGLFGLQFLPMIMSPTRSGSTKARLDLVRELLALFVFLETGERFFTIEGTTCNPPERNATVVVIVVFVDKSSIITESGPQILYRIIF